MPADLVPNEAIPELAAQIDSPAMLAVLRDLEEAGFILNGRAIDDQTAAVLQRLTELGLVDPGYEGPTDGKPYLWVRNGNGSRVLRHVLRSKIKVAPRAHTALETLPAKDQLGVLWAVAALQGRDPASWPKEQVIPLGGEDKPVYLLRVPGGLRAFIRALDTGGIELIDIVREETLQVFLERYRAGSKAG